MRSQLVGDLLGDELHLARRLAELHDRLHEFALGLQVDRMVVEADHPLHLAREHRILRLHAGRLGQELYLEPLLLEVPELLRQLGGEVDLLLDPAHHDGDLLGARRPWHSEQGDRDEERPAQPDHVHLGGDGWGGWIRTIIMGFKVPGLPASPNEINDGIAPDRADSVPNSGMVLVWDALAPTRK